MSRDRAITLTANEKHVADYYADLYAAVVALERLERANNRDLVGKDEYDAQVARLLDKQEAIAGQLKTAAKDTFVSVMDFLVQYDLERSCAAAKRRIENSMKPDVKSGAGTEQPAVQAKAVLEAGQHFITIMDCLKLRQTAADQLHPLLSDLQNTIVRVNPNFEHLPKIEGWYRKVDSMRASEELTEAEARDMLFDIDRAYQALHTYLSSMASTSSTGGGRA